MKLRSEISLEATATWPQLENTVVKSRTLTSGETRCASIEVELQAIVNSYVGQTSQRLQNRIKQHVPQWLKKQLTRPRRSQPHRSCKQTDTKPDCDSAIGQHLLDNDQFALNMITNGFQSSPQHAALAILIS